MPFPRRFQVASKTIRLAATCALAAILAGAGLPFNVAVAATTFALTGSADESATAAIADTTTPAITGTTMSVSYYFYHGRNWGSEHLVSPLRLITNGGFGILQMENRSNRLADIDWENGWRNLWHNLANPFQSISNNGWWEFFRSEVIPVSLNEGNAQYWPNYLNHLVGGGMSYRMMREWFRWHGFRHEKIWALTTITAYHLLNETVEMHRSTGWRADPIADMYIFNVAGILLFSSDGICRFFSRTLNMADWSYQPFYNLERGTLENVGQRFMVRLRLGRSNPWYLFYHWGNAGEFGLSRHLGNGHHVSAGAGLVAKNLRDVNRFSKTADLATSAGIFYDREGSLLASVLYTKTKDTRWRFNFYPGLIRLGPFRPGLSCIVTQGGLDTLVGLTFGSVPLLPWGIGMEVNDHD
jgi:hypothetical protein